MFRTKRLQEELLIFPNGLEVEINSVCIDIQHVK